mgnify:CR=1 FL=1|jgi:hypothetical protein
MKQIDLKNTDYRRKNPRTGIWQNPVNRPLCAVGLLVAIGMLGWVFSVRGEVSPEALFVGASVFAFGAGGLLALLLKDY